MHKLENGLRGRIIQLYVERPILAVPDDTWSCQRINGPTAGKKSAADSTGYRSPRRRIWRSQFVGGKSCNLGVCD